MTQIIDRSLEMLGRTESLEHLEFWQCMALTDAGVANLAALPWLEQIEIYSSPNVSRNIAQPFRDTLRAQYSG